MRGYRCDDVDDYLKQVAESMDALAAKNDEIMAFLLFAGKARYCRISGSCILYEESGTLCLNTGKRI